jgi:hypothetical protein
MYEGEETKTTIPRQKEAPVNDFPDMTRNDLEREWQEAKERFDQALANKIEVDQIYVAAANELNTLERLVKKVEQQKAVAKRKATKSLR